MAQLVKNPTSKHEHVGLIPGLTQWVKDPVVAWTAMQVEDMARAGIAVAVT